MDEDMNAQAALKAIADEPEITVPTIAALRPLDPEAMEMLELFTYTQQKINDHLEKVFAADSLSLAHYRALFFVLRYPGISVSGLIDKLDITKQSLARVLSDLIRGRAPLSGEAKDDPDLISSEDGFLYSEIDENDRRSRRLYLTKRGEQLMLEALNPVTEALRRSFGDTLKN